MDSDSKFLFPSRRFSLNAPNLHFTCVHALNLNIYSVINVVFGSWGWEEKERKQNKLKVSVYPADNQRIKCSTNNGLYVIMQKSGKKIKL